MSASSDIDVEDGSTPPIRQHGWLGAATQMGTPHPETPDTSAEYTAEDAKHVEEYVEDDAEVYAEAAITENKGTPES